MSAPTHTSGPWEALCDREDDSVRWLVVAAKGTSWHIATIENGQPGDTVETEGATAHLMAAAPELLQELRNALPLLVQAVEDAKSLAQGNPKSETGRAVLHSFILQEKQARAAITKATGGLAK